MVLTNLEAWFYFIGVGLATGPYSLPKVILRYTCNFEVSYEPLT